MPDPTPNPAQIWRYAAGNPNVAFHRFDWSYARGLVGYEYATGLPPITGLYCDLDYCSEIPPFWRTAAGEWSLGAEDADAYNGRVRWLWGTYDGITGWWHCLRYRWAVDWVEWIDDTTARFRVVDSVHPLAIGQFGRLFFSQTASWPGWLHKTPVRITAVADDDHARELIDLTDVVVPTGHVWPVSLPRTWPNRLTTRTSDTEGVLTLSEGHGLEAADLIDLAFTGGTRKAVIVVAVDDNLITISGGFGDNLPEVNAYVGVTRPGGRLYFAFYQVPLSYALFGAPYQRAAIGAQLTGATRIDFEDAHGYTTSDRLLISSTHYEVTAATDLTVTISPAYSASVGATVDCVPFPMAVRDVRVTEPPYDFPRPDVEEPTAGELVAADCNPLRVLTATETPAVLWTGLETHTWGTWLDHWMMAITFPPRVVYEPAVGDTVRLIVDYTDVDNYLAAEYSVVAHPDTEATYYRLRLIERTAGVESQLSREVYRAIAYLPSEPSYAPVPTTKYSLQVRLDPPIGEEGDAILSVKFTRPDDSFGYRLYTGSPVTLSGSRRVGLAFTAGAPKIRTITAPTIESRVVLTTRTSDTDGVWTFPLGSRLPQHDECGWEYYPWRWAVGDELSIATQTVYQIELAEDSIDEEARTLTGTLKVVSPAQPPLPPAGTVGSGDPLYPTATPSISYTSRSTPPGVHDLIFPARVLLAVAEWPLFESTGDWELVHNWAHVATWHRGPAGYCWTDAATDWTWPGWTAPADTRSLSWTVDDCPAVWGRLTTRTSATAGIVTFPHAGHEIREGDTVSVGRGSTTNLTGATVTAVVGGVVTFSGGTGTLNAVDVNTWLRVTTAGDDQAAIVWARLLNRDALALYGPHVTTTTDLVLARRLDPIDWRTGPLREDGPADDLTFDRTAIRTPYRLQFRWAAAEDDPITVLARTFPDRATGEWTATIQFPARAAGWTVPDNIHTDLWAYDFSATFGNYGGFGGYITAYDDATNQITWTGTASEVNTVNATLSTRVSDTVGTISFSAGAVHLIDVGAPIRISWSSGGPIVATVTGRTDNTYTFAADGAGDPLPAQGTTSMYTFYRPALPPPGGAHDDATGTTTWYAATWRHFAAGFWIGSELRQSVEAGRPPAGHHRP